MQHDPEDLAGAGRLIAHFLNRLPAGWEFLLRSNHSGRGRYMCNVLSPDFVGAVTLRPGQPPRDDSIGQRYPAYGATAVDAVTASAEMIPESAWIGERDGLG